MTTTQEIEMPGIGTSFFEMLVAATLVPCAACGALSEDPPRRSAGPSKPSGFVIDFACEGCEVRRRFTFEVEGDAMSAGERAHEPSRLLRPEALRAEIARVAPRIHANPHALGDAAAWRSMRKAIARAARCWFYLGDAEAPAARDRLRALEKVMVADETRIEELQQGRLAAKVEIRGLVAQAAPGVPTVDELVRYYERRTIHRTTRSLDGGGVLIEMKDHASVRAVKVRPDVVAEMTFAELPAEEVLSVRSGAMTLLDEPEWDERAEDYVRPLPNPLAIHIRVHADADAPIVRLTQIARTVEVRFLPAGTTL